MYGRYLSAAGPGFIFLKAEEEMLREKALLCFECSILINILISFSISNYDS